MPRTPRNVAPDTWHHVVNRSIAKRTLFETSDDVRYFLSRLAHCVRRGSIEVHAYSIMTTHFHLLVRTPDGSLSAAMQWSQDLFARRFNRGRFRDGPLFRGRFASNAITTSAYWTAVLAYIDRNAMGPGIVARPSDYPHASAFHHARRTGPPWLCRTRVQAHVADLTSEPAYRREMYDAAILGSVGECADEVVDRRLRAHTGAAADVDPLDDLVRAAPDEVQAWMHHKAGIADGVPIGVVLLAPTTVRALIATMRRTAPERCLHLSRKRRPAWDVMEAGLLRAVCGLPFAETATRLGLSTPAARSRAIEHLRGVLDDADYAAVAADVVHQSLAIDFGRIDRVGGVPAVLPERRDERPEAVAAASVALLGET